MPGVLSPAGEAVSSAPAETWSVDRSRRQLTTWIAEFAALELLIVVLSAYCVSLAYFLVVLEEWPPEATYISCALLIGALITLSSTLMKGFEGLEGASLWSVAWISLRSSALSFSILLSVIFLLKHAVDYSRGTFICQFLVVTAAIIGLRTTAALRVRRDIQSGRIEALKVTIIGHSSHFAAITRRLNEAGVFTLVTCPVAPDLNAGHPDWAAFRDDLVTRSKRFKPDEVLILGLSADMTQSIVDALSELSASICVTPTKSLELLPQSKLVDFGAGPTIQVRRSPLSRTDRFAKRSIDLIGAIVALTILAPSLLIIAVGIRLTSKGPILFRQTRQGLGGESITVFKFRTMHTHLPDTGFQQASRSDDRITPFGRILRRTSLDETPQLLNVLRGDMSLVGPRPHMPEHNKAFEQQLLQIGRRHSVKPGITGWAQAHGLRGPTDTFEKMKDRLDHDLFYAENWSLRLDIKILLMTIFSNASRRNAY